MTENDPRHGTWAGYQRGCRKPCCRGAARNYQKRRKYDAACGNPRKVSSLGTRRRIEALSALGWDWAGISAEVGRSHGWLHQIYRRDIIQRQTADFVAELYERMAMRLPPSRTLDQRRNVSKALARAARMGWVPPLAWDDIDDPDEMPCGLGLDDANPVVDEAVVERILAGDWHLRATATERSEVCRRWVSGRRSLRHLRDLTGWRIERYYREGDAA